MLSNALTRQNRNPTGPGQDRHPMNAPKRPWFQQFWPWFLIVLPGSVVVAAIATLFIAIKHSDELVLDDYYKDGLAINQQLSQDRQARRQAIVAEVSLRPGNDLSLRLIGQGLEGLDHLQLALQHPTSTLLDQQIVLTRQHRDTFEGHLDSALQGRWYITLQPLPHQQDGDWRLKAEWDADTQTTLTIWAKGALEP